jgi:hypothetical protein
MTIEYKSEIYDLTTSTVECDFYLNKSNGSAIFYHTIVAANSHDSAVHNTLVMEENDYLTFQVATANVISGQISYAVLSRKNQNG